MVMLLEQLTTALSALVSLQQVQNQPSVKPAPNTFTKLIVSPVTLPSAKLEATN